MDKILLVHNAQNNNSGSLDFACYLATLTNSKITGIFWGEVEEEDKFVERSMQTAVANQSPANNSVVKTLENVKITDNNIDSFKQACARRSTRYSVHTDNGEPVTKIARQTRYADLLVLDAETTFKRHQEEIPTSFVTNILKAIECPVFIAPQSFEGIEEIIFTYDASKSSMFAIKQFCYLFPQLDDKKITVLHIDEGDPSCAADHEHLKEWLSAHYDSIGFVTLKGDAETEMMAFLLKKENSIVVMGAYGGKFVGSIFKRSHAERLLKILNQPIFITHP